MARPVTSKDLLQRTGMRTPNSEVKRRRKFTYPMLHQDSENNRNIVLTWAPERQKEGKTKNKVEVYHRNRKNTPRLVNMERGQAGSCQQGNVETICGGLMCHKA